jgi:hypothetical protein
MDPVGFSVGIVGLAGLVTTCIQCFQILRSNEVFDRDTQILFRKLDLEREVLMQWAHQCGLLKRHHIDGSLFGPRTDPVIYGTLEEISILLGEAANLQGKYLPAWRDARGGKAKYTADGSKIGLRRKFMFTIDDKSEFEHIITKLEYFISRLSQLVPSVEHRRAMREEFEDMGCDARTIRLRLSNDHKSKHRSRDERVPKAIGGVIHSLNDSCRDKHLQLYSEKPPRYEPSTSRSRPASPHRGERTSRRRTAPSRAPS